MKARLGWLVAVVGAGAVALSAAAQGSAKLAVGPDAGGYLCPDGRQLYVKSCYDNSPDADCGVVLMHLPSQNGYQRESTETRSKLTPSVAACKVYPLEFRNDGTVGLVVPKSAAPQQTAKAPAATPAPSAATPTIPGPATRTALIRITGPGVAKTVHYVDEASAKPTGQKDVVEIWALQVYPNGNPDLPNAHAVWSRYDIDCKKNTARFRVWGEIDRQGKVLSTESTDIVQPVVKNSPNEKIAAAACKSTPLGGSRMLTVAAAIADADSAAAPKTTATPAQTQTAQTPKPATPPPAGPGPITNEAKARQALLEGQRQYAADDWEKALAAFQEAARLDPTFQLAWVRQGDINNGWGDSVAAAAAYEKAISLKPDDKKTADTLCTIYWLDEKPDPGIRACERVLALGPDFVSFTYGRLGDLQAKKGDHQKALATRLERARIDPKSELALLDIADSYTALKRNTDALAAAQKALALKPDSIDALMKTGDILNRLGSRDEAIKSYREAIKLTPDFPEGHAGLAVILRDAGRKAEADAEHKLAMDNALAKGRDALKHAAKGESGAEGSIMAAQTFADQLRKWDKAAAGKLDAEIKVAWDNLAALRKTQ